MLRFIVAYMIYDFNVSLMNMRLKNKWMINVKDYMPIKSLAKKLDMEISLKLILISAFEPVATLISSQFFAFMVKIMISFENNQYAIS